MGRTFSGAEAAAGDCPGPTRSLQQEHVGTFSQNTNLHDNHGYVQVHCEGCDVSRHVNVVHLFTCTTPEHVQKDI